MIASKITSDLSSQIQNVSGKKYVQVIVELDQKPLVSGAKLESRMQGISKLKADFEIGFEKVSKLLNKNGGTVIDGAWINQTMRVEVPVSVIDTLSDLKEVSAIDAPRRLTSDFAG